MPLNNPFAGLIQHVKDLVEAVVVPVGVRHVVVCAGIDIVEYHFHFVFLLAGIGEAEDVLVVGAVHGQDEVEVIEVRGLDLAGALPGNIQAVLSGGANRTGVRWFADMTETGAGRIYRPVKAAVLQFAF